MRCAAAFAAHRAWNRRASITDPLLDAPEFSQRPIAVEPRIRAQLAQSRRALRERHLEPAEHRVGLAQPGIEFREQKRRRITRLTPRTPASRQSAEGISRSTPGQSAYPTAHAVLRNILGDKTALAKPSYAFCNGGASFGIERGHHRKRGNAASMVVSQGAARPGHVCALLQIFQPPFQCADLAQVSRAFWDNDSHGNQVISS